MGVLQRFEKRLSTLVEGSFARVFHGRVEPVELAAALAREADTNKAVGPQRVLVPNVYEVALGRADYERLAPYALTLGDELAVMVSEHAVEQGYSFVGAVTVTLRETATLGTGAFRVDSRVEAARDAPLPPAAVRPGPRPGPVFPPVRTPPVTPPPVFTPEPGPPDAPLPVPDPAMTTVLQPAEPEPARGRLELPNGEQIALRGESMIIGRGAEADVRISDASVSRRHAKITVVGRAVVLEDLASTNGVTVNGRKVARETLNDGDEIQLGAATVRYRG